MVEIKKTYIFAAENKHFKATTMEKVKMNQDELYQFLLSRNIIIKRLGEKIGQSDVAMSNAFKHNVVNGSPLYFSTEKLRRINEALPVMADEISARLMKFNTGGPTTFGRNNKYDLDCLEQLRTVGDYFNLIGFTARILGWSKTKKSATFTPSSNLYGHITEADVTAVNTELLAIAGVLRSVEVTPML